MKTARTVAAAAALACVALLASPSMAQCEELEQRVELLTRQIQAMQKQILTLKAGQGEPEAKPKAQPQATPAANVEARNRAAAAKGAGREEALALYDRVDALLGQSKIDEAKQALAEFNTTYEGTPAAAWTRSLTRELTAVGKPAPADWSIERWFQGESEVALDGDKPTVVVFWESWCPHCKSEVPKLQALYDSHKARGLQVVGVTRLTRSSTEQTVTEFIAEHDVSYPIAKESGALAEYFSVKGIPAAAVVKDGKIVWRGHPTRLSPELIDGWM